MTWFNEEDTGAQAEQGAGDTSTETGTQAQDAQNASSAADLTGKPDWMPDAFWVSPEEGKEADWQGMSQKMATSFKETQRKVTEQGNKLAQHVVPDSITPYFEGIDKDTLISSHQRAAFSPEMVDQFMAQARSAGIGPGAAQGLLTNWMKSRHEATPEAKSGNMLRDEAIAELNAAGRPGSEMAKRVKTWGAGMLREQRLSDKQAEALEVLTHTPAGIEALHTLIGSPTIAPPAGEQVSLSNKSVLDDLNKRYDDQRYGTDTGFTQETDEIAERHRSLIERSMNI